MATNLRFTTTFFAVALVLAGCRGGGGSSGLLPAFNPTAGSGTASFTVKVPQSPGGATQSMVVTLAAVNGAAPTVAVTPVKLNLAANSPGCSLAAGTLTCTASIGVPAGSDTFTVATFAQPNGAGAQISISQTTSAISPGKKILCTKKASVPAAPTSATRTI